MVRIIGDEHPSQGREDKACELDEGKPFVELDDELRLQGVPSSNDRDRLDHRKDEHGIQAYGDKGAPYLCSPGGSCVCGVRLIPVPQHDEHDCGAECGGVDETGNDRSRDVARDIRHASTKR